MSHGISARAPWSFHFFASVLGIRPSAPGFKQVRIEPQLGPLKKVSGKMVHPEGFIEVDCRLEKNQLEAAIKLPEGISGTLGWGHQDIPLKGGSVETFKLPEQPLAQVNV